MPDRTATSINGVPIRLTDERWLHITARHTDMAGWEADVLEAVNSPDEIQRGRGGALIALRKRDRLYLLVVYRESSSEDGFVVTARFVRRHPPGEVLWARL